MLSVAGFFAIPSLFLAGKGFIPEGEEAPLCAKDPLTSNLTTKSVKRNTPLSGTLPGSPGGWVHREAGTPTNSGREGYIQGGIPDYTPPGYIGRYTSLGT